MRYTKRAMSCGVTAIAMAVMLAGASLSGNVTDTSQSNQQDKAVVAAVAETQDAAVKTNEKEITMANDAITSTPATVEVDPEWADKLMPTVEALNVRQTGDAEGELVGKLYKGSRAEVLEAGNEWTKIKSGNVEGYVMNKYCVFGEDAKALAAECCKTYATSKVGGLKVRYEANETEDAKLLHVLEEGEKIQVDTAATAVDGWVAVIHDGTTGYVSAEHVTVAQEFTKALTVEEEREMEKAAAAKKAKKSSSKKSTGSSGSSSSGSSSGSTASHSDLDLLAALIYCEARGESYEGQVAVGAVVMNRVESGSFPNSISGVIYQRGQFSPVSSGKLSRALANGHGCYAAAEAALAGQDNTGGALYFNSGTGKGMQIGNQHFY